MATNIPHYLTFPALSALPANSFRVRKVTHWATDRRPMELGQQRIINIQAPPNHYLLGQHSYVEFTTSCNGKNRGNLPENENAPDGIGDPDVEPRARARCKWGAGAPFARVRETLNSGSFCVGNVDDPEFTGPILAQRGLCSRRSSFQSEALTLLTASITVPDTSRGIVAGTYGAYRAALGGDPASDQSDENGFGISTLENAGYAGITARSVVSLGVDGRFPRNFARSGFVYSVPLSAYSRLGTLEFCPVGLLGAFSTNSYSLEFQTHNNVTKYIVPAQLTGGDYIAPTSYDVDCLRINATYVEILDPDVQMAIEKLFKKEDKLQLPGGASIPMRLELPFISYSMSKHSIGGQSALLRVNSNSPSVRGMMIVSSQGSREGCFHGQGIQFSHIRVHVNGYCVYENCGYDEKEQLFPTIQSDLYTEYEAASHLFSLYSPQREALQHENPVNRIGWPQAQGVSTSSFICLSFENSPHFNLNESELASSRGLDLRNVGEMTIELKYYLASLNATDKQNISPQNVAVVLAHDQVISVDRSGAHDITQSVL